LVLTGFGPFGKFERNPSWDVVESLDGEVFSCAGTPGIKAVWPSIGQISLHAVAKQLPVDYSKVPALLEPLFDSGNIGLIVNVGVSRAGEFKLEQRARNGTYEAKDITDACPATGKNVEDGPDELRTSIDIDRVIKRFSAGNSQVKVANSDDAGLYLCEYTYYRSLHGGGAPAIFIHIPPVDEPYSLEQLKEAVRQIISLLVEDVNYDAKLQPEHKDAAWVRHFQRVRAENPDSSSAVSAIRTLIDYSRETNVGTLSELLEGIRSVIDALTSSMDSKITSVSSGCELFLRFITLKAAEYSQDFDACKQQLVAKGGDFLNKARLGRSKIARKGLSFIHDGAIVLTCSYSRVTLAVLVAAAEANRRFTVYVTESAPSNLGLKFAAKLQEHGIPVTVIPDTAVGYVIELVDLTIVGAEAIVESGGIINTIGTYQLGLISKAANTPFYVVGESFKFVRLYPLNQSEIPPNRSTVARPDLPEGVGYLHPAMDYTPPSYITLIITDLGVLTPSAVSDELIKLYL